MRALFWLGVALDVLVALLLVVVFGYVLDSWHDPVTRWAGPVVTSFWTLAFVTTAGAPIVGVRLRRRGAPLARALLAVWTPGLLFVLVCVVGLALSPP